MKIVRFRQDFQMRINDDMFVCKRKQDYIFSDIMLFHFIKAVTEKSKVKKEHIISTENELSDIYARIDVNKHDPSKLIIVRTGGIGDLIALSSIARFLTDRFPMIRITFVSQNKYRDIFQWWDSNVTFVPYFKPIGKRSQNKKTYSLYFEGVIERSTRNWFELQFKEIGVIDAFEREFGRPKLKTTRVSNKPSNISLDKPSILVNCRSTSIIRSMRFKEIYDAIIDIIGDADINIYTHSRNITQIDYNDIEELGDNRVHIITAKNLGDFFLDIYDSSLTISVDTAMCHFREGIGKPGIGMYGPFPVESRTKHYNHIHSFDIQSPCSMAPCFIHTKKPFDVCAVEKILLEKGIYETNDIPFSPCLNSVYNLDLKSKLSKEYKPMIEEHVLSKL